jgi:hypothetical protein
VLPRSIIHADWSSDPKKRWMCTATLEGDVYHVAAPVQVGNPKVLVAAAAQQAKSGGAVLGFDFPIGVPKAYAERAGIDHFLDALPEFGFGLWHDIFNIAERPDEVSVKRPFYPKRPGGTLHRHLIDGIGVNEIDDLLRRCDFGNGDRNKACVLFWTLGGNQVGRAAISGWRDMIIPGMRSLKNELGIWPFQGALGSLTTTKTAVIVETYPADACVQLGLGAPGRGWSKRERAHRVAKGRILRRCALQMRADLRRVDDAIKDGFGMTEVGEDQFDSVVGILGMLAVILGIRGDGAPEDKVVRSVEGWILGQKSTELSHIS